MIGILLTATGRSEYLSYISELVESIRKNIPNSEIVLFKSDPSFYCSVDRQFQVENLGWPRGSMMRHRIFLNQKQYLQKYTHIFCMDVDMRVNTPIDLAEICGDGITAVLHPGFIYSPLKSYCRDAKSTAYIEGNKEYYQGCFQGGSTKEYLDMCEIISHNIDIDDSKGVIPEWFDEAHLNRYLFDRPPNITLSPAFAYPEIDESYPYMRNYIPRILHLAKKGQDSWK